jgi:endonuclease YncB( thermonuclease family)
MKAFIEFWKKDIINKLIVIVIVGLVVMGGALGWLLFNMSGDTALSGVFAELFPKKQAVAPTFDLNAYLTPNENAPATATIPVVSLPTFTPPPPTPTFELPTPTLELPTLALEFPTQTLSPPTNTPTQFVSNGADCIPNNPPQAGRVVEVLDGNTVRVLIEKLVYVVRYTGVAAPENKVYSEKAKAENFKLVYGKDVMLTVDKSDKDSRGRLLRYVMVGDTFINFKLIQQGLGTALDVPPDSACAQVLKQAEQTAAAVQIGIWSLTPTPASP